MSNIFVGLYSFFEKRKTLFWGLLFVAVTSVAFLASRIRFEEDITKVLPKDSKTSKLSFVFENSKFLEKIVLTVSLKDSNATAQPDSLIEYTGKLVNVLNQKYGSYIKNIQSEVDDNMAMNMYGAISSNIPVFLEDEDYKTIDTLITREKLKSTLAKDYQTLTSPAGIVLKRMIANDPVGISLLGLKKMQNLQYDDNYQLYNNHILTKDQKHLLFFIVPANATNETNRNAQFIDGLKSTIDSLSSASFKNYKAEYFGATAVAVDNAKQLRKDTYLTLSITIIGLLVVFGFFFRQLSVTLIILIPVVFGALFSLAIVYLLKGGISIIAMGAGSIVLGIAVNYSLHFLTHLRHHDADIKDVIKELTVPMTLGSATTVGGFLCLQFVEADMLKDLGLFAAFSLVGAALFSLIFLPHLINGRIKRSSNNEKLLNTLGAGLSPAANKVIIIGILVLTPVWFYLARYVSFETDLKKMNFMSEELKVSESNLNKLNSYTLQSVYLISSGKDLNEALSNNEQLNPKLKELKASGAISKYSGVSTLIISDKLQKERIEKWNRYWTAEKKATLITHLEKEGALAGFSPSAFENFKTLLNKNYSLINSSELEEVRKTLLDDYISEKKDVSTVVTLIKVNKGRKQEVYDAFGNNDHVAVFDKQYLTQKFIEVVQNDFTSIATITSCFVLIALLLAYGRIELTLITFIPMVITWVWILGIMGLLDIKFNIVNIIISTFIFGLGDDYSIFVMDGLLEKYKTGTNKIASFRTSIILSAITTILGLGVLIFASHPALKSIAAISIIGIGCVLLVSQTLVPFLFKVLISNRTEKRLAPITFFGLVKTSFAFSYFLAGCILLTLSGFILTRLIPVGRKQCKYAYHWIMAAFCRSLIYIMMNVKKNIFHPLGTSLVYNLAKGNDSLKYIDNPHKEDFSKPAVIIANHQSFLDILLMVMISPKVVLVTSDWVWNSPFFGAAVKMADYFPAKDGAEAGIEKLQAKVKDGYSIVIFPEGTRSVDGKIARFHKGAFLLAEQLQLDILPIVIHGTGPTMSKGDFLLKDGTISLKFLPRISPDNENFGKTYSERAKLIGRYFRAEYALLSQELETPAYFKKQLYSNYIYKGPVLEWYMKVKVALEDNYKYFNEQVPEKGKILDAGCGYGFLSYMLHFTSAERDITGVDYDQEKIETAQHSYLRADNIRFFASDLLLFNFETYDCIIISDVLHYLKPEDQQRVLEKCYTSLLPGGKLIVRDGNKDLKNRHKGTELSEFMSTKVVNFNQTKSEGLFFLSGEMLRDFASQNQMKISMKDETKLTSNITFILEKES